MSRSLAALAAILHGLMTSLRARLAGLLLAPLLALAASAVHADALVLVHGYLGDADSWHRSGVDDGLARNGWRYGGELVYRRGRVSVRGGAPAPLRYYTLSLPSEAPLGVQARVLASLLREVLARHPEERVSLLGHSSGGVIARLAMVTYPDIPIFALITIASPHLGTDKAEMALLAGSTPLAMMAPFMGGETLNRARPLYRDLVRERPRTLLHWLNRQPHPAAHYVSIVREEELLFGDLVVPPYSQDLNHVPALRGRALSVHTDTGHLLDARDGDLAARILRDLAGGGATL